MSEFSRMINLTDTTPAITVQATTEECHRLSERFVFDAITSLSAQCIVSQSTDYYAVEGVLNSVLNLDNQSITLQEQFQFYVISHEDDVVKFDPLDDIEVAENNIVDLGEIVAQYLYLTVCYNSG